jgi:lipid II isoglutaminyl synthase (glutamine-hydrolysing)
LATRAGAWAASASRLLGRGEGSVIGGRVALVIDPGLLGSLAIGRTVALVTGTNGKTTTTRLLAAAMGPRSQVATSPAGANLPYGLVAALSSSGANDRAVLEVDEGYLAKVADQVAPAVVVLLNLSRDQLDRTNEVRMVAARWRAGLDGRRDTVVVANADDPLVAWAAQSAPKVLWVGTGTLWHGDSVGCPACEGRLVFSEDGRWSCSCGFERPEPDAWLDDQDLVVRVMGEKRRYPISLSVPGRFNRANAAMAALGAQVLGVEIPQALAAMGSVNEVQGRFAHARCGTTVARLLLAKNPAGWMELLGLLEEQLAPVVIAINARIADGSDPSWLWDVPFEQLSGRLVVCTGERRKDLAVRMRHAGVEHCVVQDQLAALSVAGSDRVDYVGNYTAFQQLRRALGRVGSLEPKSGEGVEARPEECPEGKVRDPVPVTTSFVPAAPVVSALYSSADADEDRGRTSDRSRDGASALRVVVVHPDLLGTYGDGGNGRVLADRAIWRGIDCELVLANSDRPLPRGADVYCLGGGEDGPQVRSAQLLREGALQRAVDAGAAVLAVCAGYQIVGRVFPDAEGSLREGVGLLDVSTAKGTSTRAVGELVTEPLEMAGPGGPSQGEVALERLTGFENHSGVTTLSGAVQPLARVVNGVGNGGDGTDGAVAGRVFGTYMHGPVLARNPAFADLILGLVTGSVLNPLDDSEEESLRVERLAAASSTSRLLRLAKR